MDTSQFSPLIDSTHGTSGSSGHPGTGYPGTGAGSFGTGTGTGTGSSGSVSQQVRSSHSEVDQFDYPATEAEAYSRKKRPKWLLEILKEVEAARAPSRAVRESRQPERFGNYIALVTNSIEAEPFGYEEAARQ